MTTPLYFTVDGHYQRTQCGNEATIGGQLVHCHEAKHVWQSLHVGRSKFAIVMAVLTVCA